MAEKPEENTQPAKTILDEYVSAMTPTEKYAREAIKNRPYPCPKWCYCVTGKYIKIKLDRHVYKFPHGEYIQKNPVDYSEHRRFSLNPMCPLIDYLCPPNGIPPEPIPKSKSLVMTTIHGTRFNDIEDEDE